MIDMRSDSHLYPEGEGLNKDLSTCRHPRRYILVRGLRLRNKQERLTFKDYTKHQFFNLGEPAVRGRFLNSLPDNACHRPKIRY